MRSLGISLNSRDGFKNSKSVGCVIVVGNRSRTECRILRGSLSTVSFIASFNTRSQTRHQGIGGQVRKVPYRRQGVQPEAWHSNQRAQRLGSASAFLNQEYRIICHGNHGSGRTSIILFCIRENEVSLWQGCRIVLGPCNYHFVTFQLPLTWGYLRVKRV